MSTSKKVVKSGSYINSSNLAYMIQDFHTLCESHGVLDAYDQISFIEALKQHMRANMRLQERVVEFSIAEAAGKLMLQRGIHSVNYSEKELKKLDKLIDALRKLLELAKLSHI
jgi:hypothetical protein